MGCGGRGSGAASQALHGGRLRGTDRRRRYRSDADRSLPGVAEAHREVAPPGQSRERKTVHRAGRLSRSHRQRSRRGSAGHASGFPPASSGRLHRRRQTRLLREADFHRRARRALRPGTAEKAKQKNLSLVAGFCWRYNNMIQDTFQQMEDGAIGRLVAYYATYYTNPVKPMPPASARPAGMSDTEWQIRNWYNFVWLCGDSLVEQAVHSVDKIAWAMNDEPPVSCVGGGRPHHPRGGRQHLRPLRNQLYLSERRSRLHGQPPDRGLLQRERRLHHGHRRHLHHRPRAGRRASKARPTGPSPARSTTCTRRSTTCSSRRSARTSR